MKHQRKINTVFLSISTLALLLLYGQYELVQDQVYKPDAPIWLYNHSPKENFYSQNISDARGVQNDNTLICEGAMGRVFEVTENDEKVWVQQDMGDYLIKTKRYQEQCL